MSRLPIRVRLTAAFALATVVVLAGAGLFVYVRLEDDLNESIDAGLQTRAAAAASGEAAAGAPDDSEEGFAQLLNPADGSVIDAAGGAREPVLTPEELSLAAAGGERTVERRVPGVEGTARILFGPADAPQAGSVFAVGQSLDDRDETLAGLVASFAVGGPIAVVLASLLGYVLAAAGLRPVEAMRRRAGEISLGGSQELLPLAPARDEVRRLGETLNEMLERLRGSFERERRFVADASHELRTPVAVIKAELEAALRAGPHDPQVRAALVAALEECDGLAQLGEDLLVLARSGDGLLPVRPQSVPAATLLAGVAQRFEDRARERRRGIRIDVPAGLRVEADELRMRQALGNLVDNALRYGDGEILLQAADSGRGVTLTVSDEGAGFAGDIADRAFERFARGDGARSRGGAGLGLSIVRAIAQAHGGTAELVPGAPSGVRVWLPDAPQGDLREAS